MYILHLGTRFIWGEIILTFVLGLFHLNIYPTPGRQNKEILYGVIPMCIILLMGVGEKAFSLLKGVG
jgi:hypothetical protein